METNKNHKGTKVFIKDKRNHDLPEEIWIQIFKNLDFSTRQLVCTLVSKSWKAIIRTNSSLSGELSLEKVDELPHVNKILKQWPAHSGLKQWEGGS